MPQIHDVGFPTHHTQDFASCRSLYLCAMSLSDQLCSDLHLCDISRLIAEWRDIAPALGLTEVEENTIMRDAYTQPAQRLAMLRIWKKKHGILATYRSLADAFTRCGRQDLVDIVTDLVQETSNTAGETGAHSCEQVTVCVGKWFVAIGCRYC